MVGWRDVVLVGALLVLTSCAGAPVPESAPSEPGIEKQERGVFSGLFRRDDVAPVEAETSDGAAPVAASSRRPRLPKPLSRAAIAGGDVVVAGPDGYCIDPTTLQSRFERGFAIIASCHILSDGRLGFDVDPMLVSVTVGPRGDTTDLPDPSVIAEAAGAPLLAAKRHDGFVTVHLGAGGNAVLPGGDQRYWRGAFVVGERLVGLALYAPENSALAGAAGETMLARVRTRIISQSSPDAPPLVSAARQKPDTGGLFERLFNR